MPRKAAKQPIEKQGDPLLEAVEGKKPAKKKHPGRAGDKLSAYPLTPEQLVQGIFKIAPEDVKKIVASKPGKKK